MSMRTRLKRLETRFPRQKYPGPEIELLTEEERVRGFRTILARLHLADPFPDLEARDYLAQILRADPSR